MAATAATQALLFSNCHSFSLFAITRPFNSKPSISHHIRFRKIGEIPAFNCRTRPRRQLILGPNGSNFKTLVCHAARRKPSISTSGATVPSEGGNGNLRKVIRATLWVAEGVYILWLFLLPYAPGDPVWAISSETVNSIIGLSLNFFFILPLMNSGRMTKPEFMRPYYWAKLVGSRCLGHPKLRAKVGVRLIDAPVLHPVSEGLFNFVIGWTFMFAPLLFTDCKRHRYPGSLDVLWGLQMLLTNTFLIPYMAFRLNEADPDFNPSKKRSQLGTVMTYGAPIVALVGGSACLISALWAIFGRMDGNFGSIADRWEFLVSYTGSERLAYAFIWDICFYIVFQPWLIGENLQNVQKSRVNMVNYLRFVPVVGLIAYLLYLNLDEEI